jgi:capsular exopolysaccharide synthesis family protein
LEQYDLNLREYWRILRKRRLIIIFTTLALGVFSFLFSFFQQPTPLYQSVAAIKIDRSSDVSGLYVQALSFGGGDDLETRTTIIKSIPIVTEVARKLGLIDKSLSDLQVQANPMFLDVVLGLKRSLDAEREGVTSIINILATDDDPQMSMLIANTTAETYMEVASAELNKRIFEALKFIEEQLEVMGAKLTDAENELVKFRETHKLVSLDAQTSHILTQLVRLEEEYEKIIRSAGEINELMVSLAEMRDQPLASQHSFYSNEASTLYKNLNDKLVNLLVDRDTLLLTYTFDYPEVKETGRRIVELTKNMYSQLERQVGVQKTRAAELKKQIDHFNTRMRELPEEGLSLARLERKVKLRNQVFTLLETKHQEALIKKSEKLDEVTVVKPALMPDRPINPPRTLVNVIIGTIMGLILGMVLALVFETLDTSIGAIEDVEEYLGVKVVGIVPYIDLKDIRERVSELKNGEKVDDSSVEKAARLVAHYSPKSAQAESFRALRTNIQFLGLDRKIKTISFTSSSPKEGKTAAAVNLAVTVAQSGQKVLLVDADFRKPLVAKIFGLVDNPGLSDFILGNYEWRDVVRGIADLMTGKMSMDEVMLTPGLDNLYIITSGTHTPNPSELIGADRVQEFLEQVREEFDMVIFDSPPILSASEAAVLAGKVDGVVLVYKVGQVARGALKRAKDQLDTVRAGILGVVLNGLKAEFSSDFHDFKYYKYYYSHGSSYDQDADESTFKDRLSRVYRKVVPGSSLRLAGLARGGGRSPRQAFLFFFLAAVLLAAGISYSNRTVDPEIPELAAEEGLNPPAPQTRAGLKVFKENEFRPVSGKEEFINVDQADEQTALDPSLTDLVKRPESSVREPLDTEGIILIRSKATLNKNLAHTLQIGSYRSDIEARAVIRQLEDAGAPVYLSWVNLPQKGVWYRVFLGAYPSAQAAQNILDRGFKFFDSLGLDPRVERVRFALALSGRENLLPVEIEGLKSWGLSPYRLEPGRPVIIGAFFSYERADMMAQHLAERGVRTEIIRR